jgi:hypothetical protein
MAVARGRWLAAMVGAMTATATGRPRQRSASNLAQDGRKARHLTPVLARPPLPRDGFRVSCSALLVDFLGGAAASKLAAAQEALYYLGLASLCGEDR